MNTLLDRIGLFSQTRWPWLVIAILSAGLVLIAHNVFQVWLYMKRANSACTSALRSCA